MTDSMPVNRFVRSRIVVALAALLALIAGNLALAPTSSAAAAPVTYVRDIGFSGTAEISPIDMVTDAAGNWYVMDEGLQCIKVYSPARVYLRSIFSCGQGGKDTRHVRRARGIGIDRAAGQLWVADTPNHRVLKVALNGTVLLTTTVGSSPRGALSNPGDVTVDGAGNAYVIDSRNRVVKLSRTGALLGEWGTSGKGAGQMSAPLSIDYSAAGEQALYVTDAQNARVVKWGVDGAWKGVLGGPGRGNGQFSKQPRGIAVGPTGIVYAADVGGNRVVRFAANGAPMTSLGTGLPYHRTGPTDLAYGPRGLWVEGSTLAVADMWNYRVLLWSIDGVPAGRIGGAPPPAGGLLEPHGVAMDAAGNVYVSDYWHQFINKYRSDGSFVARWGIGRGSDPGTLNLPGGIDVDDTGGFLYIANREERAIDRWRLTDGRFDKRYSMPVASAGPGWPRDVAVDESAGLVHAPDEKGHQVVTFNAATGAVVRIITTHGANPARIGAPRSIALDESRNLYVADAGKNVVHVYGPSGAWIRDLRTPGAPRGIDVRGGVVYALVNSKAYTMSTAGAVLQSWGSTGSEAQKLHTPYVGIAVSPGGEVLIGDSKAGRLKVYRTS
jgi:sugar lactone lactonase YvrE